MNVGVPIEGLVRGRSPPPCVLELVDSIGTAVSFKIDFFSQSGEFIATWLLLFKTGSLVSLHSFNCFCLCQDSDSVSRTLESIQGTTPIIIFLPIIFPLLASALETSIRLENFRCIQLDSLQRRCSHIVDVNAKSCKTCLAAAGGNPKIVTHKSISSPELVFGLPVESSSPKDSKTFKTS